MSDVRVLGDVIGAAFENEDEAVLFMPNAGDIMICAAAEWLNLTNGTCSCSPSDVAANLDAKTNGSSETPSDLRSVLIHFGAYLR